MMGPARRGARRTARRTSRRTARRTMRRGRRRRRRRVLVGGMVVLAVGGMAYGAVKLSQKDVQSIEQQTGQSVEDLSDEELKQAMGDLGIESQEITQEDQAALGTQGGYEEVEDEADYLDELERLAELRDKGVISEEEFQAKKQQLLGL